MKSVSLTSSFWVINAVDFSYLGIHGQAKPTISRTGGLSKTLPLCRPSSDTKPNYCFVEGSGTWLMRQWWLSYIHTTWSTWVQTNMQELNPQIFLLFLVNWPTCYGFLMSHQHSSFPLQDVSWPGHNYLIIATILTTMDGQWVPCRMKPVDR